MDSYDQFKELAKETAIKFNAIDKKATIRIISHLDCDGICAASLLIKALNQDNRKYSISIIPQLNRKVLEELSREEYQYYMFSDLGSGQLSIIQELLKDKNIFVLDHHEPELFKTNSNITHLNPHIIGIDGSKEISGSGVVYFFVIHLNKNMEDLSHIPVIGAIGDVQEEDGFKALNKEILNKAIEKGKIKIHRGLRLFGTQTRPLHKVLEYSTDPYIPGVTASESGAIQFLQHLNINPKIKDRWKKVTDLTDDEMKRLVAGIIIQRQGEDKPDDVLGNIYLLPQEEEGSTKDAKEFSTLLNACGRLNKASLGIGACLNDPKSKKKAVENLNNYKREIINAMGWFRKNQNNPKQITQEKGFTIINARDNILPTMVGTIASILSKSNEFQPGTYIISLAYTLDNDIKVSLRIAGNNRKDLDLRKIMKEIIDQIGGEAGGHFNAAGAIIPIDQEHNFIDKAKEVLRKISLEEVIV